MFFKQDSGKPEAGARRTLPALPLRDIIVFPHGDPHILENGPRTQTVDNGKELARIFSEGLTLSRYGERGELTKFVCGYMACEARLSQIFLSGLPPLIKVSIRNDAAGRWLENSIRFTVSEVVASRAGSEAFLAKLSEALFVETLRRYVAELPENQTGWLAGARDSDVGKALTLLHRDPARGWTIAAVYEDAGISGMKGRDKRPGFGRM